ncbi:AAA family ATPase, partial [Rhodovulum sulfidophilum]|nr:AAA family ATPase [Rhodovulum sulfidophilum]
MSSGPGAGKTSLITELARRGFHTIPESGRAIIREEMQSGGDALPWADRAAYAERMLEQDLRAYSALRALSGPVIFDRGIPDVLGYLMLCGLPGPCCANQLTAAVALLRKSLIGRTIPFPVTFQAMASISALPRAEKRFIMAMRIWI